MGQKMNKKTLLAAAALCIAATNVEPSRATTLFQDTFQTDLSQWTTGSGVIVSAPGGGNALTFTQTRLGGDIFTVNAITSGTGSFTISFDFLGNCGYSSGCGGFVGASNTTPSPDGLFIVSDTPFGGIPQFPDTGSWEHVSYTVGTVSGSTTLALEMWASAPHAAANSVYFRDMVVTDNPNGTLVGTFDISAVSATPLPSTWLMLLSGFVGLGYFAYRGTKKNAAALAA